jgi:hypothetical protein
MRNRKEFPQLDKGHEKKKKTLIATIILTGER